MSAAESSWVCCQLGAREHYVVPRALQHRGLLHELITDLWIRATGRFHPGLSSARVTAQNAGALMFAARSRISGATGWTLINKRNDWFQRSVVTQLARRRQNSEPLSVFAYSYAAREIFEFARERGWRTVLGQIDPGPAEERIVGSLHPAPIEYWKRWRRECELADQIVVNSNWSRDALLSEAVAPEKIRVIPLAFDPPDECTSFKRNYPAAFTSERPLRVLFLGQINLRKGAPQLFDAVKLLATEPVEFQFVGPLQIDIPPDVKNRIRWFGIAPRSDVTRYYREADVFILPTHSDGFGLTQLEAQSWKLPVIASRYCGDVVTHNFNGLILDEVSGPTIAETLLQLLRSPERLQTMSGNSRVDERFSLGSLAASLSTL
jgi:glycosyltransferase involved in cell wall biosynthesis